MSQTQSSNDCIKHQDAVQVQGRWQHWPWVQSPGLEWEETGDLAIDKILYWLLLLVLNARPRMRGECSHRICHTLAIPMCL